MGAHLYWLESGDGGWWQFDNREQDGTNDWYDGGYHWCDSWDGCDDGCNDTEPCSISFNGVEGDVTFEVVPCADAAIAAGVLNKSSYSTTTIVSGVAIAATGVAAISYIAKQRVEAPFKSGLYA